MQTLIVRFLAFVENALAFLFEILEGPGPPLAPCFKSTFKIGRFKIIHNSLGKTPSTLKTPRFYAPPVSLPEDGPAGSEGKGRLEGPDLQRSGSEGREGGKYPGPRAAGAA